MSLSTEAELPGVRVVRLRLGWRQLRLGLLMLVVVLGAIALNQAAGNLRLKQDQSPAAQRDEWRRLQGQGQALARLLKAAQPRSSREADQLLDAYWSGQQPLRTPAALHRAGEDSQDLLEAAELLRHAEQADVDQASLTQAAQQQDERWRQTEHGLLPQLQPPLPAPMMAAVALLPPSPYLSLRRVAWVKAQSAAGYRAQAQRALSRLVYRYKPGP
jgi:hypothetical protein